MCQVLGRGAYYYEPARPILANLFEFEPVARGKFHCGALPDSFAEAASWSPWITMIPVALVVGLIAIPFRRTASVILVLAAAALIAEPFVQYFRNKWLVENVAGTEFHGRLIMSVLGWWQQMAFNFVFLLALPAAAAFVAGKGFVAINTRLEDWHRPGPKG